MPPSASFVAKYTGFFWGFDVHVSFFSFLVKELDINYVFASFYLDEKLFIVPIEFILVNHFQSLISLANYHLTNIKAVMYYIGCFCQSIILVV